MIGVILSEHNVRAQHLLESAFTCNIMKMNASSCWAFYAGFVLQGKL